MGFRTLGRVIEKWATPATAVFAAWATPLPPVSGEDALQYYLRVALLHPQTEQCRQCTIACADKAQWDRYPIGSWLRLWVRGWGPLVPLVRLVTIEEE